MRIVTATRNGITIQLLINTDGQVFDSVRSEDLLTLSDTDSLELISDDSMMNAGWMMFEGSAE